MIRIVLVDDHALFRSGVRAELEGRVSLAGEAATVEEAVAAVAELEPDVVLLDVHLDERGEALVPAAREAMLNGAPPRGGTLSGYAQAAGGGATVFVR